MPQATKTREVSVPVVEAVVIPQDKKRVEIEVYRKNGKTMFKFSVHKSLEEVFKNNEGVEVKTSKNWEGLKFYTYPAVLDSSNYRNMLQDYYLFDDYGHSLIRENRYFNIAFLRTLGGKGEVQLDNTIPFAVVSQGLKNMTHFIKEYYNEFLADYTVKASISMEV